MYAASRTMRWSCIASVALLLAGLGSAQADQKSKTEKIEIEGVVADKSGTCPNVTFTIAGQRVVTDASTKFEDGSCGELANGKKVEVDAVPGAKDVPLRATEVDLD